MPRTARIVKALREFGFGSLDSSAEDFKADDRVIQLGHAPNRVDMLTRLYGVDFSVAWDRRIAASLDGVPVWMISKADLIANKIATGRPQDVADVDFLKSIEP